MSCSGVGISGDRQEGTFYYYYLIFLFIFDFQFANIKNCDPNEFDDTFSVLTFTLHHQQFSIHVSYRRSSEIHNIVTWPCDDGKQNDIRLCAILIIYRRRCFHIYSRSCLFRTCQINNSSYEIERKYSTAKLHSVVFCQRMHASDVRVCVAKASVCTVLVCIYYNSNYTYKSLYRSISLWAWACRHFNSNMILTRCRDT